MTDPVDTDALRRLAHDVEHGWDTETGPSLRAAADEVDRLREANEEAEVARSAAAAYGDRLRAVIENAPHAENCQIVFWQATWGDRAPKTARCTCWKADAL